MLLTAQLAFSRNSRDTLAGQLCTRYLLSLLWTLFFGVTDEMYYYNSRLHTHATGLGGNPASTLAPALGVLVSGDTPTSVTSLEAYLNVNPW